MSLAKDDYSEIILMRPKDAGVLAAALFHHAALEQAAGNFERAVHEYDEVLLPKPELRPLVLQNRGPAYAKL